jgi:tetratricopeptide (TPR) repeat protein
LTPAALFAQLQNHRLDLLIDGAIDLPPHQKTLRRAIQATYALLTDEEQRAFRALGVFVGGFTVEGAHRCGADRAALAGLLHKSLLQQTTVNEQPRFAMLQTIREFALELLARQGEEPAARQRHTRYFLGLAQHATHMQGREKARWLEKLEQEHDNLRAALLWTLDHDPPAALAAAPALEEFWTTRGYDTEAARWLTAILDRAQEPTVDRARGLLALANIQRRLADYPPAGEALDAAEEILGRIDDCGGAQLRFYRCRGWYHYDLHNHAQTIHDFEAGLALARSTHDRSYTVHFLAALAHTRRDRVEMRAPVTADLDEALRLLDDLDEPETLAFVLQQYGGLAVAAGDYAAAIQRYERVLSLYRQLGNRLGTAWALSLVGEVAWFREEWATAARHHAEAHALFVEIENPDGIMIALHHRGQCARRLGQLANAAALYRQSIQVAETLNNRHMQARGLAGLGYVALAQGNLTQAASLARAAKEIFDQLPSFLAPPDQQEFLRLLEVVPDCSPHSALH